MQRNVAGQKWRVYAFDADGLPITGDALNITAKISKDGGIAAALTDVNPVEVEAGYYDFDITQLESDAHEIGIIPVSSTPGVIVVGSPANIVTTPVNYSTTEPSTQSQATALQSDVTLVLEDTADIQPKIGTPSITLAGDALTNYNKTVEAVTGITDLQTRTPAALVGGRTPSVAEVVTDKTGYSLTQVFPANFENMIISAGGSVDSLVQGFLDALIAETTAGRIAGNFDIFFENADVATTKTVDDVGGVGGASDWSATEQNQIRYRLGLDGTNAVPVASPNLATSAEVATRMPTSHIAATAGKVDGVATVDSTTSNADMRGTDGANTVPPDNTSITAILEDTGATIPALIAALSIPSVADILTTAMAESYAADGVEPSLSQILYELRALAAEKSIVSTTLTTKRLDGVTTAGTYLLDDDTAPTSITRSS